MLGEDFHRLEGAAAHMTFGDHALAFLEQVRQNAVESDRNIVGEVGDIEADVEAVAHDAAFLDQAADAETLVGRKIFLVHLGRAEEEH